MPLYEYRCTKCAKLLEVIQGFNDAPLKKCEACGGRLEKLISRSGFVLKGSGWYASDYNAKAKGPKPDAPAADEPAAKTSGASGDTDAAGGPQAAPKEKPSGTREKPAASGEKPAKPGRKGSATKD